MRIPNETDRLRRVVMIKVIDAFFKGELESRADHMPFELRPRGKGCSRCCVFKDRAVVKYRVMAALGIGAEDETDEATPLRHYAAVALGRQTPEPKFLSVLDIACDSCVKTRYLVTEACRGCLARPCSLNCPRSAVHIEHGRATIDYAACVSCGKCQQVCPFSAIIRTPIPCEEACPVGAISRGVDGKQIVDFDKCVHCGKCMRACPFGAVVERSQIIDILKAVRDGKKLVAMLAPAVAGQFPGGMERLTGAFAQLGFAGTVDVAAGAVTTAEHEARELVERLGEGQRLMTSSCCPAYVETVARHIPELLPFVSDTLSPMRYAAQAVKAADPDALTVFVGPCLAKRKEAADSPDVDFVMTFEELGALLVAKGMDLDGITPGATGPEAPAYAKGFANAGGVAAAVKLVLERLAVSDPTAAALKLDARQVAGLTAKSVKLLKLYAKGKLPGNFLEVMACEEGCVGGPCGIGEVKLAPPR